MVPLVLCFLSKHRRELSTLVKSQVWWHRPVIPVPGRQRQKGPSQVTGWVTTEGQCVVSWLFHVHMHTCKHTHTYTCKMAEKSKDAAPETPVFSGHFLLLDS